MQLNSFRTVTFLVLFPICSILVGMLFLSSCEKLTNGDEQNRCLVFEIKQNPTILDRDTTNGVTGLNISGMDLYDIDETNGPISIRPYYGTDRENYPPEVYSLISATDLRIHGPHMGGGTEDIWYHESIPMKVGLFKLPSVPNDTIYVTNIADSDVITFEYKDSTFLLAIAESRTWIDSMYVDTYAGSLFYIDSMEFVNHGELEIVFIEQ